MLKSEIHVGKVYITAARVRLEVLEIIENEQRKIGQNFKIRANTRYRCRNLATGRENIIKGAAKFVREVQVAVSSGTNVSWNEV